MSSSLAMAQTDTSALLDTVKINNPATSKTKGGLDKPIDYKATDSIIFDIKKNKVYLFRDAQLHYGGIDITAYYIEVDLNRKEIFAKGGLDSNWKFSYFPVLKDGEESYVADSMRYNSNSKKGRVYGLRLVQEEAYIHLEKVLKQEDGSFVGQHGKITTCSEDHPHFYFNANKIKVVPNDKVYFGSANLVVEDVPTPLAVPFGLAPIKKGRRHGILFPGYGYNQANQSFYLQNLGYYTGLGENMDLAISTDAYFNGDIRVGLNTNFVKKYKYRGSFGINASRFGNGIEITDSLFKRNLDFNIRGDFSFDNKFLPGTTLNGNVNIQTGNYNKLNSRNINSFAQNQFNSGINYGRNFFKNKLNLSTAVRHSQNTADHSFRLELPSVSIGLPGITPFGNTRSNNFIKQLRFSYNLNFNNILNTKDTILFSSKGKDEFKKLQNGISHSLPISTNFKMFKGILNISPSVSYSELWYFKSNVRSISPEGKIEDKDTVGFGRLSKWGFNTGISTNIYGTYQEIKTGKLRAIRHTITPTVSVGYNPEIDPTKRGWMRSYKDTTKGKDTFIQYNIYEKGIY
ncbi:MAG: LPS-assembly protein LptD, partial [Bacteroidia bacterium]|nr:LPS-assembly protein LptD [Bacteroidia bacterium]